METQSIVSFTTIASWTRKLSLSLLLTGYLIAPSWGQVKKVEIVHPRVNTDDQVTLRIQVKGEENRPIINLKETDFELTVTDPKTDTDFPKVNFNWKSSKETVPRPAWIIILLDMSGSMKCNQNLSLSRETKCDDVPRGQRKLDGAIAAIKKFIEQAALRKGNTQIAIVPFGKDGPGCPNGFQGYPVTETELGKFFGAGDVELTTFLGNLATRTLCASTNLYESLEAALEFLGDSTDTRFYPEDSEEIQPSLSIILLSDGFDTEGNFKQVESLLERNRQIIVHTLGYGLTPEQLGQKYRLGRPATRDDLWWVNGPLPYGKVPAEEYVEKDDLDQIRKPSGGIAAFSAGADAVAKELQVFLNSFLEYEISYSQPNPERGKQYKATVTVKDKVSGNKLYRIHVFGKAPPVNERRNLLLIVIGVLIVLGLLPFFGWGYWLKQQEKDN